MSEHYFDTLEGKLIVGEAAYEQAMEQSFPGDIRLLGELMLGIGFDFQIGDFLPRYTRQLLSSEEKLEIGRWALKRVEEARGEPVMLQHTHLERSHILGITPTPQGLYGEFGGMDGFREAIGSPIDYQGNNGVFASMSNTELLTYIRDLHTQLGRRLEEDDFLDDDRPGRLLIYNRFGGIRKVNAYLGHFSTAECSNDDLVDLGVTILEANSLKRFSNTVIDVLSRKQMAPSVATLQTRFTRWSAFKAKVIEKWQQQKEAAEQQRNLKLNLYTWWIKEGTLPADWTDHEPEDLLQAGATYELASSLLDGISGADLISLRMARYRAVDIALQLQSLKPELSDKVIEQRAESLGVSKILWPEIEDYSYLYVTDAEKDEILAKRRQLTRACRQTKKDELRQAS